VVSRGSLTRLSLELVARAVAVRPDF